MPKQTEGRYAVEVIADDSGKWCGNALRFDAVPAAEEYARDLWSRWVLVRRWRVVDTETDTTVAADCESSLVLEGR